MDGVGKTLSGEMSRSGKRVWDSEDLPAPEGSRAAKTADLARCAQNSTQIRRLGGGVFSKILYNKGEREKEAQDMDQTKIGNFIARKRKEKNLTQAQLAAALGVSDKTVSKWERGKCMPDYGLVKPLCRELGITVAELMDGEAQETDSPRTLDEQQMLDLLERVQRLEKQKQVLYGVVLLILGMALLAVSHTVGGTPVQDFLSGALLGVGVGTMLVGIVLTLARALAK